MGEELTPMATETCRDVLRDMLATGSNISDFDDLLDFHGYPPDRIRAAIAADDAERERLRRIEDAARAVADTHDDLMSSVSASDERKAVIAHAAAHDALWTLLNSPSGPMRQLDAAQRIAGEMPDLRRRHARAAVDGGRDDG